MGVGEQMNATEIAGHCAIALWSTFLLMKGSRLIAVAI